METRTFVNLVQRKLPFPITPRFHNILDPRTFLIFLSTFVECKHNFRGFLQLYLKIRKSNHPKRFLCTLPRSGTGYLVNLYKSAVELSEGKSGKPFFNPEEDSWNYVTDLDGYPTDLRNFVYEFKLKESHPWAIFVAHHPIQKSDLVDMNLVCPVFTLRNPLDACKSWYYHTDAKPEEWYKSKKVGLEKRSLISHRVEQIIYHFNYWGEYIKNKKNGKDYLCIKYEELIQNTADILKSLLQFYGMKINESLLNKAVKLNSYENTKRYVLKKGVPETKRITIRRKTDFDEDILLLIKEEIDKKLKHNFGYNLAI